MKYFIGHLSFRLLCLALTIACFSLPVFSQKSEKAVQDTIKNKTSNEKYLQTSAVSTIRYSDLDKASASNLENALTGKASGLTIRETASRIFIYAVSEHMDSSVHLSS